MERQLGYQIHRASQRGHAEHGWLHTRFSFSFAEYHDPNRMNFGALRVLNDDIIEPGHGFPEHPHRDMEIITIVTQGALEHRDSEGNHDTIHAGEVQYMSAGAGIRHSEYNPSPSQRTELLQIWIIPNQEGGSPLYDKRSFNSMDLSNGSNRFNRSNGWVVLVSPDGRDHSITIKQNASIFTTRLKKDDIIGIDPSDGDHNGYGKMLFVIEGSIEIGDHRLERRDEIQITGDIAGNQGRSLTALTALEDAHLLLFEVPLNS